MGQKKFSCFIIGESTLPIKCGEMLLQSGHHIYGIISNDRNVRQWALEKNIQCITVKKSKIYTLLNSSEFEYLLSINGDYVMPEEILAMPKVMAINYHDSPLPLYAGMYATTWALINQEKMHAVSWHQADASIDTGDILVQLPVPIEPEDTAFTLNLRCYEAALKGFEKLLHQIETQQLNAQKQDLSKRTYFGYYQRPYAASIFSFCNSAQNINAFLRALDFGDYDNPLGKPKISVENYFFIIPAIEITGIKSSQPPGTVTQINPISITVSTLTKDIKLSIIYNLKGEIISIPEFTSIFHITEGFSFEKLPEELAQRIHDFNSEISKYETYWKRKLTDLKPLTLFSDVTSTSQLTSGEFYRITIQTPYPIKKIRTDDLSSISFLISVNALYLSRITGLQSFDIAYTDPIIEKEIEGMEELFVQKVPLSINIIPEETIQELVKGIEKKINRNRKHKTFNCEIGLKYPELKSISEKLNMLNCSTVTISSNSEIVRQPEVPGLHMILTENGRNISFFCHRQLIDESSLYTDIKELISTMLKNQNTKLKDIFISNDFKYSEVEISPEDLDGFEF